MTLSLLRPAPQKSFVLGRIDAIIGRSFAISGLAISIEATWNGFGQLAWLHPVWYFASAAAILAAFIVLIARSLREAPTIHWYRAVALLLLAALLTWPLQVRDVSMMPAETRPWVWWLLGIAILAGGLGFQNLVGIIYWLAVPAAWVVLHLSAVGGSGTVKTALMDAGFLLFITAALLTIVYTLRYESSKTDAANELALAEASSRARSDAKERERDRVDALVHDSVLTTMLLAASAKDASDEAAAAELARSAVVKLVTAENERLTWESSVTSFLEALAEQAKRQFPGFEIDLRSQGVVRLPSSVAEAATEATMQVMENSVRHAGEAASRVLRLRSSRQGFKIVVSDDGRGFRFGSIPKNRLGLRLSVIQRMEAVGGKVKIDSGPARGTNIVIEWSNPPDHEQSRGGGAR